ncbi:U3-containing 90S pre-ribosomal complex subunit-domain containing protein [Protomyces lactucae-debilis]|uniref:U3-containing 90S pre-ribosomal complex subunit-domain containing protein n=1 Tax=Protomyces lactucae-debilis TaxID=2754530 RepID=A0A1Y2FNI4_PROLT|nr:U3-containing 90S pre-ribosomal complex subunit-domain containing protein [Protomyces lactucae-debilis]ORY85489.1 U3-containing 90S pre-ribosomal complex subunit-domain containing protein [Protomyces lactucae-debilis]
MVMKPAEVSADALEDDLEYEVGSDAAGESVSDAESGADSDSGSDDDEQEAGATEIDPKKVGQPKKRLTTEEKREKRKAKRAVSNKRKREQLGLDEDDDDEPAGESAPKKAKTKVSKVPLGPEQQSDLLAKLFLDHHPGLTSVELLDKTPPLKAIRDTSETQATDRSTDQLCAFLERYTQRKDIHSANKEPGTPHTLILCASAIRVADVVRPLKAAYKPAMPEVKRGQQPKKPKNAIEIVKLFGKEKLKDQKTMLGATRVSIAVGVPGRVAALLAPEEGEQGDGALKVRQLEQIILDASYLDSKKRGLLQIKEVCKDLATVLGGGDDEGAKKIRQRLRDGQTQILFF